MFSTHFLKKTDLPKASPPQNVPETCDVCIVGAGVAGSALAWYLGQQGVNVVLIERDLTEPDKFIGELLQPGGVMMLQKLGYKNVLHGFDSQIITGYGLFMDGHHYRIPYPEVNGNITTGRGFRYGKFITSLRKCANRLPGVLLVEGSVHELIENGNGKIGGVRYQSREKDFQRTIHAQLTVVCDGGFSKFRHELNETTRHIKGYMVGLLLKNCDLPYPHHGHVFLNGSSPVLSYPVSSNETRVLIDFPGEQSPKLNGRAHQKLFEISEQLPGGMQQAFLEAIQEPKVRAMPNIRVPARPATKEGVIMLGDALNMRHPLTGGGMTAALTDVQLLGSLLLSMENFTRPFQVNKAVHEFYKTRHQSNATINILADALYDVMSYPDLKRACFYYLKKGRGFAEGPISILSAISRDRSVLIRHFFAVAFFGIANMIKHFPGVRSLARSYKMLREAVNIIKPLLLSEQPSWLLRIALKSGAIFFPKKILDGYEHN